MIWAYFVAWLRREELLADPPVINYIRHTQLGNLKGLLQGKYLHE
jgi:hypothetical protein